MDCIQYAFQHQYVIFSEKGEKTYQNSSNCKKLVIPLSLYIETSPIEKYIFPTGVTVNKYSYFLYTSMRTFYVESIRLGV